ncbi:MAG: DNA polymerase III subunit [Candidatus Latescibacterota bacterium]
MSPDRVTGQEQAAAQVGAWLRTGRLPHAVLVCGPSGSGKRRFALQLAMTLVCREGGEAACGRCPACRRVEGLVHPDVHVLAPLPARRGRKEDDPSPDEVREAALDYLAYRGDHRRSGTNIARALLRRLQREIAYTPVEARRKVALVYEAECMHPVGANSLLKVLEEPPVDAVFILVSSAPDRILPTILSRCQRLRLRALSRVALREQLAGAGVYPERVELAGRLGAGSLQRALRVAAGELDPFRERAEQFLQAALAGQDDAYWELVEEVGARGERGQLEGFLEMCATYLRDLFLVQQQCADRGVLIDRPELLGELAARLPAWRVEAAAVEVDRAFDGLFRNANPQFVLTDLWRVLRGVSPEAAVPAAGAAR